MVRLLRVRPLHNSVVAQTNLVVQGVSGAKVVFEELAGPVESHKGPVEQEVLLVDLGLHEQAAQQNVVLTGALVLVDLNFERLLAEVRALFARLERLEVSAERQTARGLIKEEFRNLVRLNVGYPRELDRFLERLQRGWDVLLLRFEVRFGLEDAENELWKALLRFDFEQVDAGVDKFLSVVVLPILNQLRTCNVAEVNELANALGVLYVSGERCTWLIELSAYYSRLDALPLKCATL